MSNKQKDIQRLSDKALIKLEYFVESLLYDLDQLSQLPSTFSTSDVVQTWGNTQNDLQEKVTNLSDKKMKIIDLGKDCTTAFDEISGCEIDVSELRGLETLVFKKLDTLKKSKGIIDDVTTSSNSNNVDIAQLLAKFLKQRSIILEKLQAKYSKMFGNYKSTGDLSRRQVILKEEYEICLTTITKIQLRRQLYCWNLLKASLKEEHPRNAANATNANTSTELSILQDYNIQNELENSRRLMNDNNALWDNISVLMKQL